MAGVGSCQNLFGVQIDGERVNRHVKPMEVSLEVVSVTCDNDAFVALLTVQAGLAAGH